MARKGKNNDRIEPVLGKSTPAKGALDLRLSADDKPNSVRTKSIGKMKVKKTAKRSVKKSVKNKTTRKSSFSIGFLFRRMVYWSIVLGLWGVIAVGVVIAYYTAKLPSSSSWKVPDRPPNVRIVAIDGALIGNRGLTGGEAVPLHEMSVYLPEAIVAIEDRRFYSHFGFDIVGFSRAMVTNITKGRLVQGGSSLSQQLAKNLFLKPERTIERKVQELILAIWLETQYTKDQILELYLNRVYFGANSYGVDAAARRYFNKSARDLTLGESAMLAGLVKAPSRLAPSKNPEGARKRAQLVLSAMEREGFITGKERLDALQKGSQKVPPKKTGAQNYIADWVMDSLEGFLGRVEGDIIVETTIDRHLQIFAQRAIADGLKKRGQELGVSQGALVSMDGIGAVRAMVGGRNYGESQFNRAVKAKRQPGSSFKPFVYLTALEFGLTPDTVRVDEPIAINGWRPKNYSKKHEGPIKLRRALAKSLNTIAAGLAHEVGPQYVVETAKRLGIQSKLASNPALALGTSEVTPFELARAYVPFANGGFRVEPFIIKRITTLSGEVLFEHQGPSQYKRVIEPDHLGMMNVMLSETLSLGTGKRATLKNWPAGGKTGTSQNFRDAWFAGFTSNLTTVVWLGNDNNSPTKKASGGNLPASIWKTFMEEAHQGIPVAGLPGISNGKRQAVQEPSINDLIEQERRPRVVRANEGQERGVRGFFNRLLGRD